MEKRATENPRPSRTDDTRIGVGFDGGASGIVSNMAARARNASMESQIARRIVNHRFARSGGLKERCFPTTKIAGDQRSRQLRGVTP
jgi:hypothetical protein